jgi:hypothetical protein
MRRLQRRSPSLQRLATSGFADENMAWSP